jgi:sugar lactone lactonase YvrE
MGSRALLLFFFFAAASAACGRGGGPEAPTTSRLLVLVSGLPAGADADVTVTGPGAFSASVTASATLDALAPGSYAITSRSVSPASPIVAATYDAQVSPASTELAAGGAATVTVTYARRPGTGRLWIPLQGTAYAFDPERLLGGGAPQPAERIDAAGTQADALVFDAGGDLFWASYNIGAVTRFTPTQLRQGGSQLPSVTLGMPCDPAGAAFDGEGSLWVTCYTASEVVKYTASQLAGMGDPTPAVILSAAGSSLYGPVGIAFDASGNLWVSNRFGNTISKYTPDQLAASGAPVPRVTIASTALNGANQIAFAADGSLWLANTAGHDLLRFAPAQLETGGAAVSPMTTIASSPSTAVIAAAGIGAAWSPAGLAFDGSGDLWVLYLGTGGTWSLCRLAAASLGSDGAPPPTARIDGTGTGYTASAIAFYPPPASVPIRH